LNGSLLQLAKRLSEIVTEQGEIAFDPALAADQDMIGTFMARLRKDRAGQLAEAPLHPVADHRIADLLGNGEAETQRRVAIVPRAHEEDEAGHRRAQCAIGREEIRAARKLADRSRG
jgi:hypothetical protein